VAILSVLGQENVPGRVPRGSRKVLKLFTPSKESVREEVLRSSDGPSRESLLDGPSKESLLDGPSNESLLGKLSDWGSESALGLLLGRWIIRKKKHKDFVIPKYVISKAG